MKILYVLSFPIHQISGKSRATGQKVAALERVVEKLTVIAPRQVSNNLIKGFYILWVEIRTALWLIIHGKEIDAFISRGHIGIVSIPIARLRRIIVVREVHANAFEEADILGKSLGLKLLLKISAYISYRLDRFADIRIFNNPLLMEWYKKQGVASNHDVYIYNGCDLTTLSTATRSYVRQKYKLPEGKKILVFIGSASLWHGVDYLVKLQQQFSLHGDDIQIVCGGGLVDREIDPKRSLINISPLDSAGCADLIRASDACLLPVKHIRVSPGSPLKLYDYILNEGFVITQTDTPGYSDEVVKYAVGAVVDFSTPGRARAKIIEILSKQTFNSSYRAENLYPFISWDARMKEWVNAIQRVELGYKSI